MGWAKVVWELKLFLNGLDNLEGEVVTSEGDNIKIGLNLLWLAANSSLRQDFQNIMTNWHFAAFHLLQIKWGKFDLPDTKAKFLEPGNGLFPETNTQIIQRWLDDREIYALKTCLGSALFGHPLLLLGATQTEKAKPKKEDLLK
ncbi:hypothetical protein K435DRAFT_864418, partial [Dendrothele bispora CBS 962.96]